MSVVFERCSRVVHDATRESPATEEHLTEPATSCCVLALGYMLYIDKQAMADIVFQKCGK